MFLNGKNLFKFQVHSRLLPALFFLSFSFPTSKRKKKSNEILCFLQLDLFDFLFFINDILAQNKRYEH